MNQPQRDTETEPTGRHGDGATRGRGDTATRRLIDAIFFSPFRLLLCASVSLCLLLLSGSAFSQSPDEVAATLKKLSPEEQAALNKPDGPNDRAKNYLRIAGARLQNTRTLLAQENFSQAGEQLEIYTALVLDAGRFLKTVKLRDKAHKTIEQGLKEQLKLLESVRREVSVSLMDAADNAVKIVKRIQLQALNGALGVDNILKDSEQ